MIAEREAGGRFRDLPDLCRRLDLQAVNRRVLEALIRSGALDTLGENRATLMPRLTGGDAARGADARARSGRAGRSVRAGRRRAAGRRGDERIGRRVPDWSEDVRLAGERDTLGLYLTGHPITEYERELKPITSGRIADIGGARPVGANEGGWRGPGRNVTVAGLVLEVRKRGGRTSSCSTTAAGASR